MPPELPGRGVGPPRAPPGGDLRLRPGHARRAQLALLRGPSSASRSSPATRWSAPSTGGTDHAGRLLAPGTRVVIEPVLGCAARRHRPALPRLRRGPDGCCAATSPFGAPRARPADRVLRRHRRRLVDRGLVAHAVQLHAVPDVALRRGRRHGRADRLRRPRRARGRRGRRRRGGRGRGRDPRPGVHGGAVPPGPPRHRLYGHGRGQARPPARLGPRRWGPTRWWRPTSWPGPSGAGRGSLVLARTADRRGRRGPRLRRQRRVASTQALAMVRPRGRWCWSACRARSASTWPRCGTAR